MKEIFVSVDIETDGPIPGLYSMLSFGSVAFDLTNPDKPIVVSKFERNLIELEGAKQHESTMRDFWDKNPEAWKVCRENPVDPKLAMQEYCEWLKSLPGKPVFVGYPAGFDFTFIYYYLMYFIEESPFKFQALDIKSYAMCYMQTSFRETSKHNMPKRWFDKNLKHTHCALDDALEQGYMFAKIMADNLRSSK